MVTVLEGREAIMSVSVGWVTEGSFFRCTLIELALSILYVDPCSLDEEEHTDMPSTSDSYPSLWCSITSEGRGGDTWRACVEGWRCVEREEGGMILTNVIQVGKVLISIVYGVLY